MTIELIIIILVVATITAGAVVAYRAYSRKQEVKRIEASFVMDAKPVTEWVDRWIIIVDEEFIDSANAQMSPIDPDTGGDKTFGSVRLSPDGQEKRTHTGCNTAAKVDMTQGIFTAFDHVPWANIYNAHEWTWEEVLDDMGLQVIVSEEI